MIASQIANALREIVPGARDRDVTALAELLASVAGGGRSPDDIGQAISSAPQLRTLLQELTGSRVNANGTAIGFNGDVITVGSIQNSEAIAIGRNAVAIKLNLNLTPILSPGEINRRNQLIDIVRKIWITGVLDHSLQHMSLIRLNVAVQSNHAGHPWRLIGQYAGQPAQQLPPDATITEVFTQSGKQLLLIGEAGAGKTTALLTLAKDLLNQAERDLYSPIPVIFSLSSFSTWRGTFKEWLITELNLRYQVSRSEAQHWIAMGALLLLLDGLDEVAEHWREDCITRINTFRSTEYGLDQIVVSSRTDDYHGLQQQLRIPAIVSVLPLTHDQLIRYLASGGDRIAPIRALLHADSQLAEMALSPLMLSVIMLTYADTTAAPVLESGAPEMRQAQIFDHYLVRMLSYPEGERIYGLDLPDDLPNPLPYSAEQIRDWLRWLAGEMKRRGKSLFLIEELQPDWLASQDRWRYVLLLIAIATLFLGLVGGLGRWLAFTPALGFLLGVASFWRWGGLLLFVYALLYVTRAAWFGFPSNQVPIFAFDAALVYALLGLAVVVSQTLHLDARHRPELRPQPIHVIERLIWSWPLAFRWLARGLALGGLIMISMPDVPPGEILDNQ